MVSEPQAIYQPQLATSAFPCAHEVTSAQVDKRWEQAIEQAEVKHSIDPSRIEACWCCAGPGLMERCSKCL